MKRVFVRALVGRRAAIKQRWRAVLQNAPTRTPLANPDLLAYMIDETLGNLLTSILYPQVKSTDTDDVPHTELAKVTLGCGLNPYIGYFLAGEAALVATIRTIEPTWRLSENDILCDETELLCAFRVGSHREVNAFCEICRIELPSAGLGNRRTLPETCPYKRLAASSGAHPALP